MPLLLSAPSVTRPVTVSSEPAVLPVAPLGRERLSPSQALDRILDCFPPTAWARLLRAIEAQTLAPGFYTRNGKGCVLYHLEPTLNDREARLRHFSRFGPDMVEASEILVRKFDAGVLTIDMVRQATIAKLLR